MLVRTIPVGQLETNCYVVTNEETLGCVVIDPGDESNTILDYLEDNRLRPPVTRTIPICCPRAAAIMTTAIFSALRG